MGEIEAVPNVTSIVLTWSAPQAPNGVIISYEVTYRVNSGIVTTVNSTDASTNYTILSVLQGSTVSGISVTAFTSAGRGAVRQGDSIVTPNELTLCKKLDYKLLITETTPAWTYAVIYLAISYKTFVQKLNMQDFF